MRTEGNRSPLQIWTAGFYEFAESTYQAVRDVLDAQQVDFNEYGVDDDGPTPDVQTNNVIVPRSLISLSPNEFNFLHDRIDPLVEDGNYGIHLYEETVNIIQHFENDINWTLLLKQSVHINLHLAQSCLKQTQNWKLTA